MRQHQVGDGERRLALIGAGVGGGIEWCPRAVGRSGIGAGSEQGTRHVRQPALGGRDQRHLPLVGAGICQGRVGRQ